MSNPIEMFSPCPFCGSTELKIVNLSSGVACLHCGMTSTLSPKVIASAGKKQDRIFTLALRWNQRVA